MYGRELCCVDREPVRGFAFEVYHDCEEQQ